MKEEMLEKVREILKNSVEKYVMFDDSQEDNGKAEMDEKLAKYIIEELEDK